MATVVYSKSVSMASITSPGSKRTVRKTMILKINKVGTSSNTRRMR